MKLNEIELQSTVWLKIAAWAKDRLDTHRKQNDGDRDITETAKLRGRIAAIKELLDMESPAIKISDSQATVRREER
ncbi:MAG: hypothetical protein WC373_09570 [Smithella sp.]